MQSDKEYLRGQLPEYLQQKGFPLRRAFRCLNPVHEDKHPSMHYDSRRQVVHCFSCGVSYDIFSLIGMDYGVTDFPAQLEKAVQLFGGTIAGNGDRRKGMFTAAVTDRTMELEELRSGSMGNFSYFTSRGIEEDTCRRFGLFEASGRAYFPVLEEGAVTGWCARAVVDDLQPRYKNSPGPLGIWNGDILRLDKISGDIYVTEGIVDALCLIQMGYEAVALCGSQNAGKLLEVLRQNPRMSGTRRFVLCGDPDEAGKKMNEALAVGMEKLDIRHDILPNAEICPIEADIADLYLEHRQVLSELLAALQGRQKASQKAGSVAASLEAFFDYGRNRMDRSISTGISRLDDALGGGLYAGLYALGAISSLGKTSLALQLADFIAEHDRDVLYISLEQSKYELMAKSLSRTSYTLARDKRDAFTVRQLLGGYCPGNMVRRRLLDDTKEIYAKAAAGLYIREGIADIGTLEIRDMVRRHIAASGEAPVVMVDYLQILKPQEVRATDKQNTDRNVVELKRISRDFDIPVIAISSFNRENYRAAVSMEAFKESGAVEYSADVLMGLQFKGAGDKDLDVNAEKSKDPRELELVILKNRNGIPYATIPLWYTARFHLFEEAASSAKRYIETLMTLP